MEQTKFIETMLDILSSISDISTDITKEYIGLYKGRIMFAKIIGQKIFLLNHVYVVKWDRVNTLAFRRTL
jgi:hypothetical protein